MTDLQNITRSPLGKREAGFLAKADNFLQRGNLVTGLDRAVL
jgi:hypothetical protein